MSISFCDWFIVGVDGILPVINTRIPEIMDISCLDMSDLMGTLPLYNEYNHVNHTSGSITANE